MGEGEGGREERGVEYGVRMKKKEALLFDDNIEKKAWSPKKERKKKR